MKRILKLSLVGVVALSMFACKPDRSFDAGFTSMYILQKNKIVDGVDIPQFAPYFTVSANRALTTYNIYSYTYNAAEDRNDTTFYPLQWQSATNTGIYTYYSPVNIEKYPWTTDTAKITKGPYRLTVRNTDGEEKVNSIYLDGLSLANVLGPVKIKRARYYPGQHLTVEIEPVTNAVKYALSIAPYDQPDYRALINADSYETSSTTVEIGTNSINRFDDGQKFVIRAVASTQTGLLRESSQIIIQMGKEGAEYTADVK